MSTRARVAIGVVAAVGAVVLAIILLGSRPANGVVEHPRAPAAAAKTVARTSQHYADQYVAFDYPSQYSKVPVSPTGYLDTLRLVGPDYQNSQLAIAVRPGSVGTDPGIAQRQADPRYHSQPLSLKGASGILFTEQTGTEFDQTLYVTKNNLLISIALSDPDGNDLRSVFQGVLDSWSWPQ